MSSHNHYPLILPMCNETPQAENHQPATHPINDTNPDINETRPVDPLRNNNIGINNTMSYNPANVSSNPPSRIPRVVKCFRS